EPLALGIVVVSLPARAEAAPRRPSAPHPPRGQAAGRRERDPVEARHALQEGVLVRPPDLRCDLPEPSTLPVGAGPLAHRRLEVVQLHASLTAAGPHVRQRAPHLGVPYQGRHVLQHDRDPDVVHRCVGECLDEPVGGRATAEQPQVAGTGAVDRGGQRYGGDAHGSDPASAAVAVGLSLWVWHRVAGNGSRSSGRPASWGSRRPEHWSRGASVSGGPTSRTRSGSVCTPGTHASSRGGMPTTAPGTDTYCSADILAASCPPLSSPPPACVVPGTTCSSVSTRSA